MKRLHAFVSIGNDLSKRYVGYLGRMPGDAATERALASHLVRIDVLASSVTAMKRSFECGGVEIGSELTQLLVRPRRPCCCCTLPCLCIPGRPFARVATRARTSQSYSVIVHWRRRRVTSDRRRRVTYLNTSDRSRPSARSALRKAPHRFCGAAIRRVAEILHSLVVLTHAACVRCLEQAGKVHLPLPALLWCAAHSYVS